MLQILSREAARHLNRQVSMIKRSARENWPLFCILSNTENSYIPVSFIIYHLTSLPVQREIPIRPLLKGEGEKSTAIIHLCNPTELELSKNVASGKRYLAHGWARLTHETVSSIGNCLTLRMAIDIWNVSFQRHLEDLANLPAVSYMEVPITFKRCLSPIPLLSLRYREFTGCVLRFIIEVCSIIYLDFTAMFGSLSTTRPLELSDLSHHLTIPPILQTMSLMLFQRSVVKINATYTPILDSQVITSAAHRPRQYYS
jgi:hypothetical protein